MHWPGLTTRLLLSWPSSLLALTRLICPDEQLFDVVVVVVVDEVLEVDVVDDVLEVVVSADATGTNTTSFGVSHRRESC